MRANSSTRKVVKYNKTYTIKVKGTYDTRFPDEKPCPLDQVDTLLSVVVESLDAQYKGRTVTIEESIDD